MRIIKTGKRGVKVDTVKDILTDYCRNVCRKQRCNIQRQCKQRAKNSVLIAQQAISELQSSSVNTDTDKLELSLKLLIQAGNGISDILEFMIDHPLPTISVVTEIPHPVEPYTSKCNARYRHITQEEYERVGKNGITAEKAAQSLLCAEGVQSTAIRYWGMCFKPVDDRWRLYCNYHGISKQELINQCRRGRLLNL